jgi:hypothetical protein
VTSRVEKEGRFMNKVLIKAGVAFLMSTVVSAIVAAPSDSQAWWIRQHAGDCYNSLMNSDLRDLDYGIGTTGASSRSLICPVPDTSSTPKTSLAALNVELYQNQSTTHSQAKTCVADWDGQTGACSTVLNSGTSTGHKSLDLASRLGTIDVESDFGFVVVTLGPGDRAAGLYYSN